MRQEISAIRQIGGMIFHVAPLNVNVTNLNSNTWVIEREGVCVTGVLSIVGSKASFEIKEADRELIGTEKIIV